MLLLVFTGAGIAAPIEAADGEVIDVMNEDRTIAVPSEDRTIEVQADEHQIVPNVRPTP